MALIPNYKKLVAPLIDKISDKEGVLSLPWVEFFRMVQDFLTPLGQEKSFPLTNGKTTIVGDPDQDDIKGLSFDKQFVSQAIVEFLIQRITTDTGANELVATGVFHAVYKPTSQTWAIVSPWTPGPSTSGITFSITSAGQVQYTSSNITGTASISRIVWRARTLAAKHSTYSKVGG